MEIRLDVDDKANSGGVAIDAIRCAQLALDKGVSGNLKYRFSVFDETSNGTNGRRRRQRTLGRVDCRTRQPVAGTKF